MGYTLRCGGHTYITLEFNGSFIRCYDNDIHYMEEIIYQIEKRTGMKFRDIPIKGTEDDFLGLRFFNGGWKRNLWNEFPDDREIESFMNPRLPNKKRV